MSDKSTLSVARLGVIEYATALALQEALVAARMRDRIGDTLLLLEHPHVYTLGRGADSAFILDAPDNVPIYRVSRGGQVTYHGPGQLVAYPILKLEGGERDINLYLRKLEQIVIDSLSVAKIACGRREGLTGVWIGDEKIASIGVGIRRWTTLHGFAINVAPDLRFFERIVPCGIAGCRMTSLARQGRPDLTVTEIAGFVAHACARLFGHRSAVVVEPRQMWSILGDAQSGDTTRVEG